MEQSCRVYWNNRRWVQREPAAPHNEMQCVSRCGAGAARPRFLFLSTFLLSVLFIITYTMYTYLLLLAKSWESVLSYYSGCNKDVQLNWFVSAGMCQYFPCTGRSVLVHVGYYNYYKNYIVSYDFSRVILFQKPSLYQIFQDVPT